MRVGNLLGAELFAILLGSAGCAEELTLPGEQGRPSVEIQGGTPSDGITGAQAGADDADDAMQSSRVPVPDQPRFTSSGGAGDSSGFGGAGGEAGEQGEAGEGHKPAAGGRGGALNTHGGSGGRGGTPSSGGANAGGEGGGANAGGEGGASSGGAPAAPTPGQLFFSEYVEGSGSLKALELFAASSSSLEGCELLTYFNGKLEPGRLALHGSVAAGDVYVLCSTALASAEPSRCDRSTSLTFNGNDALALACQGLTLDVIGQLGVDPGVAWGAGATADHTLRRKCSVRGGRSDGSGSFDPSLEWSSFGIDTFSDLGTRTCATQ